MKSKRKQQKSKTPNKDMLESRATRALFIGSESFVMVDPSSVMSDSLRTLNEISKGLSIAMPNQELFNGYSSALKLQKSTIEEFGVLNEKFKGEIGYINNVASNILAPTSATIAGIGLATANAGQLFNLGKIGESDLLSVQKLSDLCLDTILPQQELTLSSFKAIEDAGSLISRFPGDAAASLRMMTNGLDGVMRSIPAFPSTLDLPDLETIRKESFITKEELIEHQSKLDTLLQEVDVGLVEFRLGCWNTFHARGRDYIGQASSSMRRLVDKLLPLIAPDKEVIDTDYFKMSPMAKTGRGEPTRRARIYCATDYDKKRAEHLKRLATGLLSAYDNLAAWDHRPEKEHDFVYGSFITIEGYLLSLLSEFKRGVEK